MWYPLVTVASAVVLGVLVAAGTICALRRRSYRRWPRLLRWPFFGVVACTALGAAGLVSHYAEAWGAPAAEWGYRVYRHEIDEGAKRLRLWVRRQRRSRVALLGVRRLDKDERCSVRRRLAKTEGGNGPAGRVVNVLINGHM
jgi:hypothetical protein